MGNASANGFGNSTTAAQAARNVDLSGKVIIITGASAGIGIETARVLMLHNAHVVMACRSKEKMATAATEIETKVKKQNPKCTGKLTQMILNLSSLKSVRQFAQDFLATSLPLHVLCLNAGVMVPPLSYTEEGFELQMGTNHLAHFALTNLLLDHMVKTCGNEGRVVSVSSTAHNQGVINFEDMHYKKRNYGVGFDAYGASKLANILFARELNRKLQKAGLTKIHAYSLHPGVISTELGRDSAGLTAFSRVLLYATLKSVEQGAATSTYCICEDAKQLKDGEYYADCNISDCTAAAKDMKVAEKLWEESEKQTATTFPL